MPNRLSDATSPYLLQHKDNPVDWYQWGPDAFAAARERDVPILLSVGYASCHWCHVMAHESFEDPATAEYMNEHFVNVKVDREERPDVDRIYMDAVQAMTGHGGWPMTVFLDHDGRPFYAGTYFPRDDRPGYPSFHRLMSTLAAAWKERRSEVEHNAEQLAIAVRRTIPPADGVPGADIVATGLAAIGGAFDSEYGGVGRAPKFPQAPVLELLLRAAATGDGNAASMLGYTLERMAAGGIYDQLGGGFARYAVDREWLVPHFEKMLYDNALLARIYIRAAQVLDTPDFARVGRETLAYMDRDLGLPDGGFASSEDADSEGIEGKFYVWGYEEFVDAAGDDAGVATDVFGVTPEGNFEESNILTRPATLDEVAARHDATVEEVASVVGRVKAALLERRGRRVRPGLDDKVVTAWNGLAIRAYSEAAVVEGNAEHAERAATAARFVLENLMVEGRLMRSWREGATSGPGFCDDYAALAVGLFALFRATSEPEWFRAADELTDAMVDLFAPPEGGFFTTGTDADELLTRPRDLLDNPAPAANSLAIEALLAQQAYTGRDRSGLIGGAFRAIGGIADTYPTAVGHALAVLHSTHIGIKEVAVVGAPHDPERLAMEEVLAGAFRPHCIVAIADGTGEPAIPLLDGRTPASGPARGYVCSNFVCAEPATSGAQLAEQLAKFAG